MKERKGEGKKGTEDSVKQRKREPIGGMLRMNSIGDENGEKERRARERSRERKGGRGVGLQGGAR